MKILLVQALGYLYPWTGAHKANRIVMEGLAAKGHTCKVVAPLTNFPNYNEREVLLSAQSSTGHELLYESDSLIRIRKQDVEVHVVTGDFHIFPYIKQMTDAFGPDITIVSDNTPNLLFEAVLETGTRTVFFAHSQTTLPFGPDCSTPNPSDTRLFSRADGIVSVSRFLQQYLLRHGGLDSEVIYFPSYGTGPFPHLGNFDNPYITVINPSAIKGFSIFIGLARSLPQYAFAAVPTWATSEEELEEMKSVPNITVLKPAQDVNEIYKRTKVFLMPSLWGESFGQVVVEAMLRGIPVIASSAGGLPEAKLGLDYLIPVKQIERYVPVESLVASIMRPIVPEQNLDPWRIVLQRLMEDREHYEQLSIDSHSRAEEFVASLGMEAFEAYFRRLIESDAATGRRDAGTAYSHTGEISSRVKELLPETRERLLHAIRGKGGES
jgi:glycosyltransferase involved in cell wall biosynthesis